MNHNQKITNTGIKKPDTNSTPKYTKSSESSIKRNSTINNPDSNILQISLPKRDLSQDLHNELLTEAFMLSAAIKKMVSILKNETDELEFNFSEDAVVVENDQSWTIWGSYIAPAIEYIRNIRNPNY